MGGRFIRTDAGPANIRAIWDMLHDLKDNLTAARATIATQADTITSLQSQLTEVGRRSSYALMAATATSSVTGSGTSPAAPAVSDGGAGDLGCSQANGTGHVSDAASLETFGKICCGVGQEYPTLLAPVGGGMPERNANRFELLGRMIWHVNLNGGFQGCSRYYPNPSNVYSLLFTLNGTQHAYRVISYESDDDLASYTTVMVYGGSTPNQATPPDPGISD